MAYLTKNPDGTIHLWNNKPDYNSYAEIYQAWLPGHESEWNEVPLCVNENDSLRNVLIGEPAPCCMELYVKGSIITDNNKGYE